MHNGNTKFREIIKFLKRVYSLWNGATDGMRRYTLGARGCTNMELW